MSEDALVLNGIDGTSGGYLTRDVTLSELARVARGERVPVPERDEFKRARRRAVDQVLGPMEGVDPKSLAESGWAVIFSNDTDPAVREALAELLEHRKEQASQRHERRFREFAGPAGVLPGESKSAFLARHGAGPGPVDPDRVPYYLLLVGDPESIPYRFQYQLDVGYAVGRIHFDTPDEYARYGRSVIDAETGHVSPNTTIAMFGVRNPDDRATRLSADDLVEPLARFLERDQPRWNVRTMLAEEATKARLATLLGERPRPDVLFTASHGIGFASDNPRQREHQGALLCQDWPGPEQWTGRIPVEHYFSADDVGSDWQLQGLMAFHFACFGAGTPKEDEFAHRRNGLRRTLTPHAFVGRLPQRLLAHPKGGALAVVGHVERVWSYSFRWADAGVQRTVFESALKRLLEGHPVGSAMQVFDERHAAIAADLLDELEEMRFGKLVSDERLAKLWAANNDARAYVIIGDPATRQQAPPVS
jgi:hypothetical protein